MNQTYKVAFAAVEAVPRRQVGESTVDWHSRVAGWQSQYTRSQPECVAGALVRCSADVAEAMPESEKLTAADVVSGTSRDRRNEYQAQLMRERRAKAKAERDANSANNKDSTP
jgi:hypothetical protein